MQQRKTRLWPTLLVLVAGIVRAQHAAIASGSPNAGPASTNTATAEELAKWNCPAHEEKFLPGDFFYCLATSAYGRGDYARARKFFETAASWASKPAQYVLAVMAWNGDQQTANHALGLAWFALAAERHRGDFVAAYNAHVLAATTREKADADKLLVKMRPLYADATAAVRAERRYKFGMDALKLNDAGGSTQCFADASGRSEAGSSPDAANAPASVCLTNAQMAQAIDKAAVNVFDGWSGHVSVGDVQTVGPAASPPPAERQ